MLKSGTFLVLSMLLFYSSSALAQRSSDSGQLFSPSVGHKFHEIAYELADFNSKKGISSSQAEQALVFLAATTNLDSRANYVLPDMIKLACRPASEAGGRAERDYSQLVHQLLTDYISRYDRDADLEVAREAVRYLLEQLNSREQREQLLEQLLQELGGRNAGLDSELATLLGLLMAERADTVAASFYLMQAFESNKYNKLAFEKLSELVGEQIKPVMYLEHLRLALGENPLDIESALAFAQYAEQLQLYETAADAYKYTIDLFQFLRPSQPLPDWLYLPWMISCYNTQRSQHRCLQIAEQLRQSGRFNLLAEAIAGKAAAKIGNVQMAAQILKSAETKALELAAGSGQSAGYEPQTVNYEQLAWFYCFVLPDAASALDWANKAYSTDPNSSAAAAVLAYSLTANGQMDFAKSIIDNYPRGQIADLAMAQIQLEKGQRELAFETLKSVIASDAGSLEAEHAKGILARHGGEYIAPIEPDIILAALKDSFGRELVPTFISPEKIISVRLNVRGSEFSYGRDFGGSVTITNNSSEPLIISDDGLFTGNIRVDADISGDLNKKIPNLVSIRIQPALRIEPDNSIFIPLRLVTGELRQMLFAHPQASLDIEFTVFLDPVITDDGEPVNRLSSIEPTRLLIKRPGVKLTPRFLQNRLNSLSKGKQQQKIRTARLFVGLLTEQEQMANREPLYKFMYADWMPDLLKSALLYHLTKDDWVAKVHTMAVLLALPLDYELIDAVSKSLNDTHWPTRLMALYLLARNQDGNFGEVLDWTVKYDSSTLVCNMAIALGAAVPEQPAPSEDVPEPNQPTPEAI